MKTAHAIPRLQKHEDSAKRQRMTRRYANDFHSKAIMPPQGFNREMQKAWKGCNDRRSDYYAHIIMQELHRKRQRKNHLKTNIPPSSGVSERDIQGCVFTNIRHIPMPVYSSRLKEYAADGNSASHRTAEPTEFTRFQEKTRDFERCQGFMIAPLCIPQ